MPAKAGIQASMLRMLSWTPACAGVTFSLMTQLGESTGRRPEAIDKIGGEGDLGVAVLQPVIHCERIARA